MLRTKKNFFKIQNVAFWNTPHPNPPNMPTVLNSMVIKSNIMEIDGRLKSVRIFKFSLTGDYIIIMFHSLTDSFLRLQEDDLRRRYSVDPFSKHNSHLRAFSVKYNIWTER